MIENTAKLYICEGALKYVKNSYNTTKNNPFRNGQNLEYIFTQRRYMKG